MRFESIKERIKIIYMQNQNCHETDLEMSPRPLGTTVLGEIYIRTMGKYSYSSENNIKLVYSHFYDHVDHHIFQLITALHWKYTFQ